MNVFEQHNEIDKILSSDEYAMYLRKSRADLELEALGEGETLEKHRKMLYQLAAKHNIRADQITEYKEIVSGESIQDRPQVQKLLNDVYAGKYKGVLVVEVERLARGNTKDQGEIAEAFQFSDTLIITPAKVYDPNNEFDQEYFEFGLFMSRREYKTIRRRLEAGKLQAVKDGNYILPSPPYGFEIVKKSKKERTLVEKPEESRIVKMVFDWYTEDRKPTTWIAKQLTNMGIKTRKNRETWARSTIKDMLFNAHYIGKVSWGCQQTIKEKDPVTGKVVKKRKMSEDTVQYYDGKHKGFISEEQFYKVRQIYGSNAPAKMNTELVNPLSGLLVCCDCGRAIRFHDFGDTRSPRYNHPFGYKCKKKSIASVVVMKSFLDALNSYIKDFQIKMETCDSDDEKTRHKAALEAMEHELQVQEQRKRRLFDSWEADDGMYTRDEFIERKQGYDAAIDKLKAQIKEFKENVPTQVDYETQITNLHIVIDCINDHDMTARTKNTILKQFIDKITFDSEDFGTNKGGKPILKVFLK